MAHTGLSRRDREINNTNTIGEVSAARTAKCKHTLQLPHHERISWNITVPTSGEQSRGREQGARISVWIDLAVPSLALGLEKVRAPQLLRYRGEDTLRAP
jgi:hypothetical protein